MNTRKLTLLFTALVGLAVSAFAQSTATEATVARVTGTVTATLPDGSTVAVTEGTKLPQGATITTGEKSEAYLVSHGDTTSVITENSVVGIAELSTTSAGGKVTELKTTLDLKSGNLVAKLNPAKKNVNQYSVRTPKGVAAARGTVFTVSYKGTTYSIAVVKGVVRVTPSAGSFSGGGDFVEMGEGRLMSNTSENIGAAGTQTGDWIQSDASGAGVELRELLAVAVATVAVAAEKGIGGTTAAELREVADAVIKADPSAAPTIAALVAVSAPTQSQAIIDSTATNAPTQSNAVQQAVRDSTPAPTTPTTPGAPIDERGPQTPPPPTPQPIDPSTVSRSGEE